MALKIHAAPTVEPLTLAEVKLHLRLDSGTFADDITTVQSIAPGAHVVAAAYSLLGSSVEVLGYSVLVNLIVGVSEIGGKVDVRLQHSDNGSTWTTFADFDQVTISATGIIYEKAYTGTKRYLRAVATVATHTSDFGVNIIKGGAAGVEDDLLTALIVTARQYAEDFQRRVYITQTWELWLDAWPDGDNITIPLPILQAVNSITYYDTNGDDYDLEEDVDYIIDIANQPGRVVLAYGKSWPSITLQPANGICIEFDAGYGDAAADVPDKIKQAILLIIGHLYENREMSTADALKEIPLGATALLTQNRIFGF